MPSPKPQDPRRIKPDDFREHASLLRCEPDNASSPLPRKSVERYSNVMAVRTEILVVTGAEADQNLIAPRPEAVVGRPASEASRRGMDLDVTDTGTAGLQTPVAWLRGEHGSRKGIRRRNQQARAKAEDKRGDVS